MTSDQATGEMQTLTGVDKCKCGRDIPFHARNCPYCQADVGFPHVRKVMSAAEVAVLNTRYDRAKADAIEKGTVEKLEAFELMVAESSSAVICRSITEVIKWLEPNRLYTSFHNEISTGARIAQDNRFDRGRGSIDELLFPEYSEHISYAALSLDQLGSSYYGDFSVVIETDAIASRATAFHGNSFLFVESRGITAGSEVPAGYGSSWENRGKLAVAKLGQDIGKDTEDNDFISILYKLPSENEGDDGDYIEVQIYGGILGDAIQSIKCNREYESGEKHFLKKIIRQAEQNGIKIELG